MVNVIIPEVTEAVLQRLASLAQAQGHSLEEEARRLLEQAVVSATQSRANDILSLKDVLRHQQMKTTVAKWGSLLRAKSGVPKEN